MKKIALILFLILCFYNVNKVYAAFTTSAVPATNDDAWKNLKAVEFVKLSANDFSKLQVKKLALKEKISFSVLKFEMKKESKKNTNLTVAEYLHKKRKLGTGWIILISVLGAFLLLILAFLLSGGNEIGL